MPLLPALHHPYPDAEVSGGILAELWLEWATSSARERQGASRQHGVPHRDGRSPQSDQRHCAELPKHQPGSDP